MMASQASGTSPTIHISQGEHAISDDPETMITTILGSCVAACLRDPVIGVGGMNHILLPDRPVGGGSGAAMLQFNDMEVLINALIKVGAVRERLEAKVFGGARMVSGLSDIGQRNGAFVVDLLGREGIRVMGQSLGGEQARRVQFWPVSGRARQRLVEDAPPVETKTRLLNDVELF